MIGPNLELPDGDQREWLLDGLARLITQRGHEKFLEGPVLLPVDEHFPDLVEPGPHGARTLLRRLGTYAGIGQLGVRLKVYEQPEHHEFDRHGVGHGGAGAAAWFAGIHAGVCEYGVERHELRDPEDLVGTLGHEVAHAFRDHHALVVPTRDVEEKLTDVTAVYLGFGVFLLNSSESFKTGGYSASGERLLYERKARGYLAPPQIAFLLAAQAVARRSTPLERRALSRALSPNHAKLFDDACRLLDDEMPALDRRLGIPEGSRLASEHHPAVEPLPADPLEGNAVVIVEGPVKPKTRAFRIKRDRRAVYAVLGAGAPIVFAATGLVEGFTMLGSVAAGAAVGYVLGRRARDDRCTACLEPLSATDVTCPSCHATLFASLSNDEERLEAEEALDAREAAYDYFADTAVSDEEKVESRLLTAIYVEWLLLRGLVSPSMSDRHPELVERVRLGQATTVELFELWDECRELETEVAAEFAASYFDQFGQWNPDDYALLTTANRVRDTRAGYRRVQALLDRHFDEWQAKRALSDDPLPSA